jgi:HlyD family secretion protein
MASRSLAVILLAAGVLTIGAAGFAALQSTSSQTSRDSSATPAVKPQPKWLATAAGRVEPRGGEIKIITAVAGRIVDVPAKINDKVSAGDVLVRIDDADVLTRLAAAQAEVAARQRERDTETVTGAALERRKGQDAVADADRKAFEARLDLDAVIASHATGSADSAAVTTARQALTAARSKLDQDRAALKRTLAASGIPLLTRLEAGLAAARADLLAAEVAIERTRIRAPIDGTVLQVTARLGEIAAPSADNILAVVGDLSALRVRAEVEERDVAKVRVGQRVSVRSDATGDKEFTGQVATMAKALGPPRLGPRGPRRPNDVDVLEILIDLESAPQLLPGMRVDVYFKPEAAAIEGAKAESTPKATN